MIGANYVVELTAESLLQCSVTALTTPPPPLPTGGPFAALDTLSSNVTLSSGNLTAPHNDTAVAGARCTSFRTSGKYFFSVTVGSSNGAFDGIGLLESTQTFTTMSVFTAMVYALNSSIGNVGPIFVNGTSSTKYIGLASAGDIIDVAVDLDASLMWVRRNNGFWNGESIAHPELGSRGIGPFGSFGSQWAPAVCFSGSAGNNFTANFGTTAFTHAAPSGFVAGWPL